MSNPASLFETFVLPILERELEAINKLSVHKRLGQEDATLLVKYTRACVAIRDSDTRAKASSKSGELDGMSTDELLKLASELLAGQGYDVSQIRQVLSSHKERQ